MGMKVVVFFNHAATQYLLAKKDSKPRLTIWILVLKEFDIEIRDKSGKENIVADHMSLLIPLEDPTPISETFPIEHLFTVQNPPYVWAKPYLWNYCVD